MVMKWKVYLFMVNRFWELVVVEIGIRKSVEVAIRNLRKFV
jgi:hypothetical protein